MSKLGNSKPQLVFIVTLICKAGSLVLQNNQICNLFKSFVLLKIQANIYGTSEPPWPSAICLWPWNRLRNTNIEVDENQGFDF